MLLIFKNKTHNNIILLVNKHDFNR